MIRPFAPGWVSSRERNKTISHEYQERLLMTKAANSYAGYWPTLVSVDCGVLRILRKSGVAYRQDPRLLPLLGSTKAKRQPPPLPDYTNGRESPGGHSMPRVSREWMKNRIGPVVCAPYVFMGPWALDSENSNSINWWLLVMVAALAASVQTGNNHLLSS